MGDGVVGLMAELDKVELVRSHDDPERNPGFCFLYYADAEGIQSSQLDSRTKVFSNLDFSCCREIGQQLLQGGGCFSPVSELVGRAEAAASAAASEISETSSAAADALSSVVAAVVRAPPKDFRVIRQEWAAIRIQTTFRGFLQAANGTVWKQGQRKNALEVMQVSEQQRATDLFSQKVKRSSFSTSDKVLQLSD
ncbi:uncharacterized protein LOC119338858 [Triticum dicoccoides]|uniref:uncharacterized protein LOC119338858 n=1 Tax=Triticum dicoccoides TaxID=85692 RepID=UPI001890E93F|nr:uncharacterized protein LOC119338858 [Triticum dicoccoides]